MTVRTVLVATAASILAAILMVPASLGALEPVQSGVQVCKLVTLPGLSAQYSRALRDLAVPRYRDQDADPRNGAQADFQRVARGILGPLGAGAAPGFDAPGVARVGGPTLADLPCDDGVRARDEVAWSMGLAGYSAPDISDVLEGVATVADLDDARSLRMSGASVEIVEGFLSARKQELAAQVARAKVPLAPPPASTANPIDSELIALAWRYGVSADLVRAVITAESNWNAAAVSSAGAIGLMQLMPATAAALGVNPWKPLENMRGGIAYLSGLLRTYGENARLALIAYHAGPQHANLVRDGRIVANAATQRYLAMIDARYRIR